MKYVTLMSALLLALALPARGQFSPDEPRRENPTLGNLLGEPPSDDAKPPAVAEKALDPPSKKALDEARAVVRDLFKKEMDAVKTPAQSADLARVLFKQAWASKSDPAGYFALLEQTALLAAKGGDVTTAFAAIDELTRAFRSTSLGLKRDALVTLGNNLPPPAHKQIAELALSLIDRAIEADDYALARDLVKIGGASGRKAKDAATAKVANTRTAEVEKLAKQFAVVKDALATLEKQPADPAANLLAGTYFCFSKGDWARGLPMLAQGGDAALKSLAEKDLAQPTEPAEQVAIGDAWWATAEKGDAVAKGRLQSRTAEWYQKAIPKLSGLSKAKAEKRVAEAAEFAKGGGATPPVVSIYAKALNAVKNREINKPHPEGPQNDIPWMDVPEPGGIMVGLDVGLSRDGDFIQALQGVYATQRAEVRGKPVGMPTPRIINIRAKPGFAIGAITVHSNWRIDGLSVTFMQISGDRLISEQSYTSDYCGRRQDEAKEMSGGGEPIIGLHGHISEHGRLASLGLVTPALAGEKSNLDRGNE